jgi:hypothetical protein
VIGSLLPKDAATALTAWILHGSSGRRRRDGRPEDHRMAHLFAILSHPVRVREGAFAVVIGSNSGVEVKEFASLREATNRYRLLVTCFRMAIEAPIELVIIDGETEYLSLRRKFDAEYARRTVAMPPMRLSSPPPPSPLRRIAASISNYLG